MAGNPYKRSPFEGGIENVIRSVKKTAGQTTAAAQAVRKQLNEDIVAQLYGKTEKSPEQKDINPDDPQAQQQLKQQQQKQQSASVVPPVQQGKAMHKLGGMANVSDHAKYRIRQQYLAKGDHKGAEHAMHHMQHYYDDTLGTLEDTVKKEQRKVEQEDQQRKQEEEEEEKRKKEEEERKKQAFTPAQSKGRNRMGMPGGKKASSMERDQAVRKRETGRGNKG